jgi:hypothetical protein
MLLFYMCIRKILISNSVMLLFFLSCMPILLFSQAPGCPNIQVDDETINCNTQCVDLVATYSQTGETTSYDVSSISYSPPSSFSVGTSTIVGTDDVWGNIITIPFNFCFFGNNYNQLVLGSNGVISFDLSNAGGYCAWGFSNPIPNTTGVPYRNAISGAYHDIDPSVGGIIKYSMQGSYPCRRFVVNYYNVPHFM